MREGLFFIIKFSLNRPIRLTGDAPDEDVVVLPVAVYALDDRVELCVVCEDADLAGELLAHLFVD